MKKLKICIYAISKNEEQFVKRFCDSAKEADLILIADTGSTDNTVKFAKECGATVHEMYISPWRFDIARNVSLSLIPSDFDVCVSLDLDEVMEPGWRQEIENLWVEGTNRMSYKYAWSPTKIFYYTKIHSRKGFRWHHPVHEYVVSDRTEEKHVHTDKVLVSHFPDNTKSRGQYLDLLRISVIEDPSCSRNAFYYGRELYFYNKFDEAIEVLNKFLNLPKATWTDERSYAYRLIGLCYAKKEDLEKAYKYLILAHLECQDIREPLVELAEFFQKQNKFEECNFYANKALSITKRKFLYMEEPDCWSYKPHDLAAISYYYLGKYDKAIEHGKKALETAPNDERLKINMDFYSQKINNS